MERCSREKRTGRPRGKYATSDLTRAQKRVSPCAKGKEHDVILYLTRAQKRVS